MPGPIDGGVHGAEPGESEDNILATTAHDVKEMLLGDPFNVGVEGASVMDCTSFVCSLIDVMNSNRGGKFLSGEMVFSDKLPVNARDVYTRVYQGEGVNSFQSM